MTLFQLISVFVKIEKNAIIDEDGLNGDEKHDEEFEEHGPESEENVGNCAADEEKFDEENYFESPAIVHELIYAFFFN